MFRDESQSRPSLAGMKFGRKIAALPAERIVEIEDFVDFIRLREQERTLTRAAGGASAPAFAGAIPKTTSTMPFEFGDVVLVPFPLTSQRASKKRPAVVVSNDADSSARSDLSVMTVTSQLRPNHGFGDAWISGEAEVLTAGPQTVRRERKASRAVISELIAGMVPHPAFECQNWRPSKITRTEAIRPNSRFPYRWRADHLRRLAR